MDETGVMLSMLGSVKVLVGKDDVRGYRGAGVKRTMVTAVSCNTELRINVMILSMGRYIVVSGESSIGGDEGLCVCLYV
ncbi:hypothetical protein BU23DRAFT_127511 [Bimuria novae-zelandiae CBS 107.79]|uniref:Uncharacterized protein n=1 Tax=Bimuria novae-zelandiae CBS 107.79 TaxID=1447943 RepID=A0A6A5VBA5_9PLEO|nr:hypothetical protein BU23DRAFT_127511 [Bimuria novae-zelandiae CBS 107.79]